MFPILHKMISFFKIKDELCGQWTTEDGSGFSMIMGSWIEFKPNGKGKFESWGNGYDDTTYHYSREIIWKRLDRNKIEITEIENSNIEIIEYKLEKINNQLELSNLKTKRTGIHEIKEFWNFAQIMFKIN